MTSPHPASVVALDAARVAALGAMAGSDGPSGYLAARASLETLTAGELLDAAALMAALLGRRELLVTADEWTEMTS